MKSSGFPSKILILCLIHLAAACRPHGGGERRISVHRKSEVEYSGQNIQGNTGTRENAPEENRPKSSETPIEAEPEAVTGFDQVFEVFNRNEYGPCSSCHESEWPYLSRKKEIAWTRFLKSLDSPKNGVLTKEELTIVIIGCLDITEKNHCSGDPLSDEDNLDEKMPTKFGYDPVSIDDLRILQKFLSDGVRQESGKVRIP